MPPSPLSEPGVPACLHCLIIPGAGRRAGGWTGATDPAWREHFPPCCFWCLRRLIAGALYDTMVATSDSVATSERVGRWAAQEADDYLGCLFGET